MGQKEKCAQLNCFSNNIAVVTCMHYKIIYVIQLNRTIECQTWVFWCSCCRFFALSSSLLSEHHWNFLMTANLTKMRHRPLHMNSFSAFIYPFRFAWIHQYLCIINKLRDYNNKKRERNNKRSWIVISFLLFIFL